MKKPILIAVAALLATPSMTAAALAGQIIVRDAEKVFQTWDANKDGVLSFDEVLGAYPTLPEVFFNQADSNDDGVLDESEYAALEGLTAAFDTDIPLPQAQ